MDNMNRIPRASSFENDLQNVISNFITNNLDRFLQNDRLRRDTTDRIRNLSSINVTNGNSNIISVIESLNNNMLLYHINISDYLTSMNRILDNLEQDRRQQNEINANNRRENLFERLNRNNTTSPVNSNQQTGMNSENNDQSSLNPRATYYYRTAPIGENRNQVRNQGNAIRRISPLRNSGFSSIRNNALPSFGTSATQRSPFTMFQYFANNSNNTNDSLNNNELMQEYFQNLFQNPSLFQNVIVSPTAEQIEYATETILYDSNMDLINHNCPITLEEFQENERLIRIIHCGHTFSESGIRNWFRSHVRCPVCRFDIRDSSLNRIENNNNENQEEETNNNNNNINIEENENEEEEYDNMNNNDSLPPAHTLNRTTSELSNSSSSTLSPTHVENIFWHDFANNIRDSLNDNMETILQSTNQPIGSRIQIDIPFLQEDIDSSNNFMFHSSYEFS